VERVGSCNTNDGQLPPTPIRSHSRASLVWSLMKVDRSHAPETRFPFLQKRRHAFFFVFGGKREANGLGFEA